jgi:hypothetical protein
MEYKDATGKTHTITEPTNARIIERLLKERKEHYAWIAALKQRNKYVADFPFEGEDELRELGVTIYPYTRKEAKARGLKFYNTMIPCKRGHMSNRYVSTRKCVECAKERK